MEIKQAFDILSDCARAWGSDADWYDSMHEPLLSALHRFGQKTICDFIDAVRAEGYKTVDDIDELFEELMYDAWNIFKSYQNDHCDRLAELWRYRLTALREAQSVIERNK